MTLMSVTDWEPSLWMCWLRDCHPGQRQELKDFERMGHRICVGLVAL